VRHIAPYLCGNGWDVTVYGRGGQTRDDDPSRDPRVRGVAVPGLDSKSLSTLSHGLTSAVCAAWLKPDVALVLNVANGFFLPLLAARGVPTLVNVDGIEWERAKWGRSARLVFFEGAKMVARHADELIVDSREVGRKWKAGFGRSGLFIPYGGDPREPLAVEPGLESGRYALLVARFVPENTVREFFDAAAQLARDWTVVLVGSSGYGGQLDSQAEALSRENPNVRWLGHVNDDDRLHSLWQHAGAYFHGHSVGGTNPALVQAMALGAPTVARDTPYNREVLDDAGVYVQPDPAAIAARMGELLADAGRRAELSSAARKRAADYYSWDDVGAAYESALTDLATGGPWL
jgi:glycosyltransferase involved in cell wall biosynthesis